MKNYFLLLFCFVLFSNNSDVLSQGNSNNRFINKIHHTELNLNPSQALKFNKLKVEPLFSEVIPIKLGSIPKLLKNGILDVQLPDHDEVLHFKSNRIEAKSIHDFIWSGNLEEERGEFTIYSKRNKLFGYAIIDGENYKIQDLGNHKNVLIRYDLSKFEYSECGANHINSSGSKIHDRNPSTSRSGCNIINVLVLYTQEADIAGDPVSEAQAMVDQTNLALLNSAIGVNTTLVKLVGTSLLSSFTQTPNDINQDYDELKNSSEAQNKRATYGADIVVLLTKANYNNGTIYGGANANGLGNSNEGFAIVELITPSNSYVFPHELMHTLGARHQNDGSSFERGHILGSNHATIMSTYGAVPIYNRILHYSNPDVNHGCCSPTGVVNQNDVARQIENETSTVAGYSPGCGDAMVYIVGPWHVANNSSGTWCSVVNNCNLTLREWYVSNNGFNYTKLPTNASCITRTLTNNEDLWIRVEISCTDGQTDYRVFHVINEDNPNCNPCFRIVKKDETEDSNDKTYDSEKIKIITNPNPSSDVMHMEIDIPRTVDYRVFMTNQFGKLEKLTYSGQLSKGKQSFSIDVSDSQNGLKYLIVKSDRDVITKKLLVMK